MKKGATLSRKHTLDIYPPDQIPAATMDTSGLVEAEQELAQLVWKYFGEEIRETLREVQQAFAPDKCRSNNT